MSVKAVSKFDLKWKRSADGPFLGVCGGLAKTLDIDPLIPRLMWVVSVLFAGGGILLYLILAAVLPKEGQEESYFDTKVLGVCRRLALNYGWDLSVVRPVTLAILFFSFGIGIVAYFVLWLVLPETEERLVYYEWDQV